MSVSDKTISSKSGGVFTEEHRIVIVHDGSRGARGFDGPRGLKGATGTSVNVTGTWVKTATYCPNDAVSWRSSVVNNVSSLYIQKSNYACSTSTLEPNMDPLRWTEIGATDWDNAFGGIWHVYQQNHGFTRIGQPVGYSYQSDSYILADSRRLDELAIAVVREVVDADRVVLQSSGEVPNIDPAVIWPSGGSWEPGKIYYVSAVRGFVSLTPPNDPNYYANPILMPTDVWDAGGGLPTPPSGGRNGVALPWTPSGGPGVREYVTVGWNKFYYTIGTDGQTDISGPDDTGSTLAYIVSDNTDVFLNGLNLSSQTEFTATDGTSISIGSPMSIGDQVEVWTPAKPLDLVVPSTAAKLDSIEGLFNDVSTDFPLTIASAPIEVQSTLNVMVWLDATAQEPLVDYIVVSNPSGGTDAWVRFAAPIEQNTRFWGTVFEPVGG